MPYKFQRTPEFTDRFRKLTRKNRALEERLIKKIDQILANPDIGVPKSHSLRHVRGSHVDPYVIVYVILDDAILFLYVDHHDKVYSKAAKLLAKIEAKYSDL